MNDLYERLKAAGFDREFVRECILPDWWSDELASVPANRSIAELSIARHFGFQINHLRDRSRTLVPPRTENFRLKRSASATEAQVAGAVAIAKRAAELVAESAADLPCFDGPSLATAVRAAILQHAAYVDLESLLTYCWSHGIAVIHLIRTSTRSKKIAGLATFCGDRPVIVLASGRDSPPWIAFHLAHELGHIMREHVRKGGGLLVDQDIDRSDEDQDEQEADRFACELLTGETHPGFKDSKLPGPKLAQAALRYGESRRISPGTVVLVYGRSASRFPAAQAALKFLSQERGAHSQIAAALDKVLRAGELPESTGRFLTGCAGLAR